MTTDDPDDPIAKALNEALVRNGRGGFHKDDLGIGLVVDGKWRLTEHLGSGGFGHVYAGWHIALHDDSYALKFLDAARRSEQAEAQFLEEARMMSLVRADSLVRVTDYGALPGGTPYFVMDRLWGKNLRERLNSESRLSIAEAVEIAAGLLDGLVQAHAHGLVHGDIKPENTFLSQKGSPVRLLDFGLVGTSALTSVGGIGGTPPYMAPEVLLDSKPPAVASDVYAVGVVLYEMLAGRLPCGYLQMNLKEAKETWSRANIRAVRIHRTEVPEALSSLLDEALAKDPQLRPTTALTMLERLRACVVTADAVSARRGRSGDGMATSLASKGAPGGEEAVDDALPPIPCRPEITPGSPGSISSGLLFMEPRCEHTKGHWWVVRIHVSFRQQWIPTDDKMTAYLAFAASAARVFAEAKSAAIRECSAESSPRSRINPAKGGEGLAEWACYPKRQDGRDPGYLEGEETLLLTYHASEGAALSTYGRITDTVFVDGRGNSIQNPFKRWALHIRLMLLGKKVTRPSPGNIEAHHRIMLLPRDRSESE